MTNDELAKALMQVLGVQQEMMKLMTAQVDLLQAMQTDFSKRLAAIEHKLHAQRPEP